MVLHPIDERMGSRSTLSGRSTLAAGPGAALGATLLEEPLDLRNQVLARGLPLLVGHLLQALDVLPGFLAVRHRLVEALALCHGLVGERAERQLGPGVGPGRAPEGGRRGS